MRALNWIAALGWLYWAYLLPTLLWHLNVAAAIAGALACAVAAIDIIWDETK